MPTFSVIVPLYNKSGFIEKTIDSILGQTFKDFEVIVVNDASTDDGFSKLKKYEDPRIKLFQHKQNKGLSATRNTAISKATAKNIALLDADDQWEPKHLENIFFLIQHYPQAKLYGTNYVEKVGDNSVKVQTNLPTDQQHFLLKDFFTTAMQQPPFCPSSLAFKKEVFEAVGGFNENVEVGEDTDFLIRATMKFKFAYHNKPTCIYTLYSENQITTSFLGNKKIPDFFKFEKEHPTEKNLKKYIDFQRYTYGLKYKAENNVEGFNKMLKEIDLKNLNHKQRFLLNSPRLVYIGLRNLKVFLLKKSVRLTSF